MPSAVIESAALELLTDDVPEVLAAGALPAVDALELPAPLADAELPLTEPVPADADPVDDPALADDVEPSVRLRRYFLRLAWITDEFT